MRISSFSALLVTLALAAAPVAHAQEPEAPVPDAQPAPPAGGGAAADAGPRDETPAGRARRLDALFEELRRELDREEAAKVAARIQGEWAASGSATVDLLMGRAAQAQARKDDAAALDLLDQTVVLAPDYAEGWNRRATLHYAENRYGLSLADIAETLRREPRHFGALAGRASMLEELGRRREALVAYEAVLAIYPALKEAQDSVLKLSDELAGDPA